MKLSYILAETFLNIKGQQYTPTVQVDLIRIPSDFLGREIAVTYGLQQHPREVMKVTASTTSGNSIDKAIS